MAKIRGIKPETWTDDKFVQLTPLARLLFIGMWNLACDNGHVEDNAVQLKIRLLPMDSCDVRDLVEEMVQTGQIERCEGYLKVIKLVEHQHIDRRWLTFCEWCEQDEHKTFTPVDRPARKKSTPRAPDVRKKSAPRAQDAEVDCDVDGDGEGELKVSNPSRSRSRPDGQPNRFEEFWIAYDRRGVKKQARDQWTKAAKKAPADLLISAASEYIAWMRSEGKHPEFTPHAHRWLRDERWTDERPARQTRVQAHIALAEQLHAQETPVREIGEAR